jgi:ketosteroid isomerase-like protein
MSQENVEAVRTFIFAPAETDYTDLFNDDQAWATYRSGAEPVVEPAFEGSFIHLGQVAMEFVGLDGMRESFLQWLAPWERYYDEIEDCFSIGDDRVLVLGRQRGYLPDQEAGVVQETAAIYTLRRGRIARIELYATRAEALEAVGLSE